LVFWGFQQVKKKLPKVNQELAARLLTAGDPDTGYEQTDEAAVKAGRRKKLGANLLKDERFSAMFKDKVSDRTYLYISVNRQQVV
jgi:hypothetical protein